MPRTTTSLIRSTAIFLTIGAIALASIVAATIWLVERSATFSSEVQEALEARRSVVELRRALQEMESAQRGYLLTGDESYLEPYETARDEIVPRYEELKDNILPFVAENAVVVELGPKLEQKIGEMEQTITLYQEDRVVEALEIIQTDLGRELMEDAVGLFDRVVAATETQLREGASDQADNTNYLRTAAVFGGLVILMVVGGAVWTAVAYTRELLRTRNELTVLNADLEERVNERTQEIVRANEEVQRFAYIVTHDLRAPLVNIMGFTSELDDTLKSLQSYILADGEQPTEQEIQNARTAATEDLPEAIGFIRSSTQRMDSLINAILKISRDGRRALKPEPLELRPLLDELAASVSHQVTELEGEIEIDCAVDEVVSDKLALEQIVGNLLDNAVKYCNPERPLTIGIAARYEPGNRVKLEISDNGRGISEQDHERVFDLFRRAGTQDSPGEGIGLAHVRTLVRNLGGDITLRSELGEGTTFFVTLPTDIRNFIRRRQS